MTDQINQLAKGLTYEVTIDDVMEKHNIVRSVTWYEKKGDSFVGEAPIHHLKTSDLQAIFGVPKDDPMYDCYPIGASHVNTLQKFVDVKIDIHSFDYFVECGGV